MPKPVARQGDQIVHGDGTVGLIVSVNAPNVLVQGLPIATEGDICSIHGGSIKSSQTSVFASGKLVAVGGDTVQCPVSSGVIVIVGDRTVFTGI